jgi:hypothetical protein
MSLKAKLCILKNYTLLLLGPSPFEHWLKSYLYITERPLCFLLFYNQVPFVFPNPVPLSVFSSAARRRPRPALSAALQLCAPLHLAPRVALFLLSPPALPAQAALIPPRRADAPSGRHAAPSGMPAPPAVLRWLCDLPVPFLLSYKPCIATKLDRAPSPRLLCLFPSPHDTEPPPLLLARILLNRATPPKFSRPIASSPLSLTPRADSVQPRPPRHRNCLHPEPPLTGAARASPRP